MSYARNCASGAAAASPASLLSHVTMHGTVHLKLAGVAQQELASAGLGLFLRKMSSETAHTVSIMMH